MGENASGAVKRQVISVPVPGGLHRLGLHIESLSLVQTEHIQNAVALPGEVDDDISLSARHFREGERSDFAPHSQGFLQDAPHLVLAHLPGEAYDPGGDRDREREREYRDIHHTTHAGIRL